MKRTKEHQEKILERIQTLIKDKGLNQTQLSKITGIAQGDISKYLKGDNTLADGFIYTMILKFSINPQWLENGEGEMYLSPNNIADVDKKQNDEVVMSREVFNVIADQAAAIKSQQYIIQNYVDDNFDKKTTYKSCVG